MVSENSTKVLRNHRPQTELEAKFSAEFAVAAAAIAGRCTGEEVSAGFVRRADVQALMGKVKVEPLSDDDPGEPGRSPFDWVELSLADGRRLVSEKVDYMRGHFKRGVARDVLWQKFADCAAAAVDRARARQLFDALQDLPRLSGVGSLRPELAVAAG
jgi:2-methylcitrate dehydratase PrpD